MKLFVVALVLVALFFSCPVDSSRPQPENVYEFPAKDYYKFSAIEISPASSSEKPGVVRFRKEVGLPFMITTMQEAADLVFAVLGQTKYLTSRKHWPETEIHMEVNDTLQGAVGFYTQRTKNLQVILISAAFMENLSATELKPRIKGLVMHEMTHVWQWYGDEAAKNPPAWLFEGIANYVPMSTGYQIFGWPKPGTGNKWDEDGVIAAGFLSYCNEVKPGFVSILNKMMKTNYSDDYFAQITGKSIQQLWTDYKNKYPQK